MLISRLLQKRFKVVDRTITNHTPKPIRLIKTVAMDIRLYVAMMISSQSLLRCIGERMLYIGF